MEFHIRAAVAADAPLLPEIEKSSGAIFRTAPGLEWIADDAVSSVSSLLELIADGTTWVAETGTGTQIAYLGAERVHDALHIWEVAVHADYQRQGIGRRLLAVAEDFARHDGLHAVTLTTFRDIVWNEPFYRALGFQTLAQANADAWLAGVLADEVARGLPAEKRCAMRKVILPLATSVLQR